ncbi:MAG TPA: glycosyltransferase family 4 protein, partial [Actinomycetota bacterium]|nr:glycosyltransferase family 4 protein [Actinomycetota bacterium]
MSKNSPEAASGNANAPTKVLLVSQAPGLGGGERVVLGPIARTGLDVTVAAWPEVAEFSRGLGLASIDMPLPFIKGVSQMSALIRGGRRIARTARELEAAVLYANGSRAITYCLAASRFGAPPLLLHHHGFLGKGPVGLFRAGVKRWASSVLAPSRFVANDLDVPGRTTVIPYGIDLTRFAPSKESSPAKRSFGLDPGSFVMGYVMRAAPGKGIEDFLATIPLLQSRFPQMQFLLAGGPLFEDDRAYFNEISSRAASV